MSGEFERVTLDLLRKTLRATQGIEGRLDAVERRTGLVELGLSGLQRSIEGLAPRVGDLESREAADEIEDEIISDRDTPGDPSLIGRIILVAEDEEHLRIILRRYLEQHGAEVLAAASYAEAHAIAVPVAELHAAIIDYRLENGARGLELAQFVRARWPRCRILITTGDAAGLSEKSRDVTQIGARVAMKPDVLEPLKELLDDGRPRKPVGD